MKLAKARRKAAEARFFASAVSRAGDADAAEYNFNALLGAGKNVRNAIHAQVLAIELTRSTEDVAKPKSKAVVESILKEWKRTVSPVSATLFDALQEARDLEVHVLDAAAQQVEHVRERVVPTELPPIGSAVRPVFAGMLLMGAISAETTVFESTFELKLDPTAPKSKRVRALFKQFSRGKPRSTAQAAEQYVELLDNFVNHCESKIRR
jgi:hypothetical protein